MKLRLFTSNLWNWFVNTHAFADADEEYDSVWDDEHVFKPDLIHLVVDENNFRLASENGWIAARAHQITFAHYYKPGDNEDDYCFENFLESIDSLLFF